MKKASLDRPLGRRHLLHRHAPAERTREAELAASFAHGRGLARAAASSFYLGMKLLPEPERAATYVLYAWLRVADDLGDGPLAPAAKVELIERFRTATHRALASGEAAADPADPHALLWPALRAVVERYRIPLACLDGMLEGQLIDQRHTSYATFADLYRYCYHVASLTGVACLGIWGCTGGGATTQLAEWRGVAFQLTNILRDVAEDARRGRVYLPAEDLGRTSLAADELLALPASEIARGAARLAARAQEYFAASAPLDEQVSAAARPCLWAMTTHYRALLERIARRPELVAGGRRVRLGRVHKIWIFCHALARRRRDAAP